MNQTPEEEHPSLQAATYSVNLGISTVLAILSFALAYPVANWLHLPGLTIMLQWYSLTLILSTIFAHCELLLNAKTDFRGVCWIYCIRQGLLVSAIALCFLFKFDVTPQLLAIFYLLSFFIAGLLGLKFGARYIKLDFHNTKKWIPKIWRFGRYVFGTNASATLFRSTDNFITANTFVSPVITSYYNACLRISNLADMPSQVLGDIMFPKVAKYGDSDKDAIKNMYEKTVGATLTFSIPALLILLIFPSLILQILAGKEFLDGAPILRVTAFFGFSLPFIKQFGTIMDATGNPDLNFKTMFSAVFFNICTNLIGVHFFGVLGAALGTATTYFTLLVVTQIILYRKFGIKYSNVFKNTFSFYPEFFRIIKYQLTFSNNKA